MAGEDKDPNIYGTLTKFKEQYDARYLIRISTVGDFEPVSYVFEIPTASTGAPGSQTGASSPTVLIDTTAVFKTLFNLAPGLVINNLTDGSSGTIISVDTDTQITTSVLIGGIDQLWEPGDTYEIVDNRIDIKLTRALEDASDEIDGYILSQVATPMDPFPDYFEKDCYKIAVRILIQRKGYADGTPDAQAVKDGQKCLDKYFQISKGHIKLKAPDTSGKTLAATSTIASARDKVFTKNQLDAFNLNNFPSDVNNGSLL